MINGVQRRGGENPYGSWAIHVSLLWVGYWQNGKVEMDLKTGARRLQLLMGCAGWNVNV